MTDRHAPHTTAERLEHLERLTAKVATGDPAAIARQRDRGKGTARERIEALFDPGRSPSSTGSSSTATRTSGCCANDPTATA